LLRAGKTQAGNFYELSSLVISNLSAFIVKLTTITIAGGKLNSGEIKSTRVEGLDGIAKKNWDYTNEAYEWRQHIC